MTFHLNKETSQHTPRQMIRDTSRDEFRTVQSRAERRKLYQLLSPESEYILKQALEKQGAKASKLTLWLPAGDAANQYNKNQTSVSEANYSAKEKTWFRQLEIQDRVRTRFNWYFFSQGDSRNPEVAGIAGAFMGSAFTIITALALSFPVGVGAAIYLEEFAPKNKFTGSIIGMAQALGETAPLLMIGMVDFIVDKRFLSKRFTN